MDEVGRSSCIGSATDGAAAKKTFDGEETAALCRVDPIVAAIAAFRAGMDDFRANAPGDNAGADAYAEQSYRAPLHALESWKLPAVTRRGAIDALRVAADADADGDYSIVGPMLLAALAYFDTEE